MSQKGTVRAFFAALGSGDSLDDFLTEDMVVWTPLSGEGQRAPFMAGVKLLAGLYAGDFVYHIDSLIEEGTRVAAEVRSTGTFTDGEPYAQAHAFLFDLRDGRIARMAEYMNTLVTTRQIGPRIGALMAKAGG